MHDLGTSGDKASIYDSSGCLLAAVTSPYKTVYPGPSCCEQEPEEWWNALTSSSRAVLERANVPSSAIAAIGFSGQMMACVAIDQAGRSLRPAIIWADTRAERQADRLSDSLGFKRVYRICGHRPSPSYSAAKIRWVKEMQPDVYARSALFLQPKDYVIGRATGHYVTDPSDASGTNLFDLENGRWSEELIEAAGLDVGQLPGGRTFRIRRRRAHGGSCITTRSAVGYSSGGRRRRRIMCRRGSRCG